MLEQTLEMPGRHGGGDAAAARVRPAGLAAFLDGLPARPGAVPAPARTSPRRRRSCCSCRATTASPARCSASATTLARRVRQPGVPAAGGHAVAAAAGRLRCWLCHARLLPRRLSLRCLEGGQARRRRGCSRRGQQHEPRRPRPPPGWCATSINTPANLLGPVGTGRVRRLAGQALRCDGRDHRGDALDEGYPDGRRGRPRLGAAAAGRDLPLVRQWGARRTRRWFRCAARASVSIPAATT